jgi:hypothetical protein
MTPMVEYIVKVKIPSSALDHRWYIDELQKEMPEGFTFDWLKRLGWPMDWQGYTWVSVIPIEGTILDAITNDLNEAATQIAVMKSKAKDILNV